MDQHRGAPLWQPRERFEEWTRRESRSKSAMLKVSAWVLMAIVRAAGFVIVALGGAFGGAGAMVR